MRHTEMHPTIKNYYQKLLIIGHKCNINGK